MKMLCSRFHAMKMRISRVLKFIILFAFCGMSTVSIYILFEFLPELEAPQDLALHRLDAFPKSVVALKTTQGVTFQNLGTIIKEISKSVETNQGLHIGSDNIGKKQRYLIYRCDTGKMGNCSDWFDIFKGIETSYLIANLTGRIFKAEIHGLPCKLEDFMSPLNVNWSLMSSFHSVLNKGMAGVGLRIMDNNHPFYNNIQTMNWTEFAQEHFDYVYFKSNLDSIPGFQNSVLYKHELSWMSGVRKDRIHAFLFHRLFTLSQRLKKTLDIYIYSILPSNQHKLLCVDLTTHVTNSQFNAQQLTMVWNFLRIHSETNIHKIFLLTDSWEVLSRARRERFKDRLVESPMLSLRRDDPLQQVCDQLEAQIFHQHLMVNCDILVVSNYGIGRLAAYLRRTDDGLFCLTSQGHIHPCTAQSFHQFFQSHT
ncbi:hypothetical protein Bpfe_006993 [Biomphalaria pfeifferi]|uniref:Uncharacterized protein n=1 Tax=Biomphalaria pfeifferi TaxID=112525 RepID=A0AAD8C096_BIOPF|nr:hypothetical protein Bpfe_006993 [Biomphalaria pfeifferi]